MGICPAERVCSKCPPMSNPASATTTGEFSLKGTYSLLAQWLVLSLSLEQPSAGAGDTELCSCLPLPGRGGCIYAEPPGLRSRGRTKPGTHLAKSLRSFPLRSLRSLPRLPCVLGPQTWEQKFPLSNQSTPGGCAVPWLPLGRWAALPICAGYPEKRGLSSGSHRPQTWVV